MTRLSSAPLPDSCVPHRPHSVGHRTSFLHDARNQLIEQQDAVERRTTLTYDAAGRMAARQNAREQVTTYAYDARGAESERWFADNTRVTTVYDRLGDVVEVVEPLDLHLRLRWGWSIFW